MLLNICTFSRAACQLILSQSPLGPFITYCSNNEIGPHTLNICAKVFLKVCFKIWASLYKILKLIRYSNINLDTLENEISETPIRPYETKYINDFSIC